ncbi:uncharacterized protein N7511_001461 [Penicillium nucicola]|uniref:uncharacterized protein n=1 Tax=Penicillium nucicola TaxID=1850975 RepID=UPI002545748A|nr:uncharacterized protein N7511_001461 [Penicillium nucicola]KAJ5776450.1 hypothetical protein N7511_001461 [Penicillium nucicola]
MFVFIYSQQAVRCAPVLSEHSTNVTDVEPPYDMSFSAISRLEVLINYSRILAVHEQSLNQNYLPICIRETASKAPGNATEARRKAPLDNIALIFLRRRHMRTSKRELAQMLLFSWLWHQLHHMRTVDVNISGSNVPYTSGDPIPAEGHKSLFSNIVVPRATNFNPDVIGQPRDEKLVKFERTVSSGISWVAQLPQQNQTEVDYNDGFHRNFLRELQAVYEIVDGIFQKIESLGILEHTYVVSRRPASAFYSRASDAALKKFINIPWIIRRPRVLQEKNDGNCDEAYKSCADIFDMLGIDLRDGFGEAPIPLTRADVDDIISTRYENLNVEH